MHVASVWEVYCGGAVLTISISITLLLDFPIILVIC